MLIQFKLWILGVFYHAEDIIQPYKRRQMMRSELIRTYKIEALIKEAMTVSLAHC